MEKTGFRLLDNQQNLEKVQKISFLTKMRQHVSGWSDLGSDTINPEQNCVRNPLEYLPAPKTN